MEVSPLACRFHVEGWVASLLGRSGSMPARVSCRCKLSGNMQHARVHGRKAEHNDELLAIPAQATHMTTGHWRCACSSVPGSTTLPGVTIMLVSAMSWVGPPLCYPLRPTWLRECVAPFGQRVLGWRGSTREACPRLRRSSNLTPSVVQRFLWWRVARSVHLLLARSQSVCLHVSADLLW